MPTLKVAAVQVALKPGHLSENLQQVERLAEEAFSTGAKLVALPEFFTTPIIPVRRVYDAVLPAADNPARRLLLRLAAKHKGYVGGSFLVADGDQIYNRYHFVEPGGRIFTHDKDLPTMWENAFYTGGGDDGVFATELGGVGAAVCWELIRTQTVARMRGRIGIAVTGTHWWDLPDNWPGVRKLLGGVGRVNRELSEQAPVEFAKRIGAPVLQASHSGPLAGDFYLVPGFDLRLPYGTSYVGATQIVDAFGGVLAARSTAEGPGIVAAAVTLGAHPPSIETDPRRFWIPRLGLVHQAYWRHQNLVCRGIYRRWGRKSGLRAAASQDSNAIL